MKVMFRPMYRCNNCNQDILGQFIQSDDDLKDNIKGFDPMVERELPFPNRIWHICSNRLAGPTKKNELRTIGFAELIGVEELTIREGG